jgi:hypothetical protein
MITKFLMVAMSIAALVVTPALAVSDSTRRACEAKAEQVRPALRAGEKEAYIANCLANSS